MKTLYQCECCNSTHESICEAEACEESHFKVVDIHELYHHGSKTPTKLIVTLKNNKTEQTIYNEFKIIPES